LIEGDGFDFVVGFGSREDGRSLQNVCFGFGEFFGLSVEDSVQGRSSDAQLNVWVF